MVRRFKDEMGARKWLSQHFLYFFYALGSVFGVGVGSADLQDKLGGQCGTATDHLDFVCDITVFEFILLPCGIS